MNVEHTGTFKHFIYQNVTTCKVASHPTPYVMVCFNKLLLHFCHWVQTISYDTARDEYLNMALPHPLACQVPHSISHNCDETSNS